MEIVKLRRVNHVPHLTKKEALRLGIPLDSNWIPFQTKYLNNFLGAPQQLRGLCISSKFDDGVPVETTFHGQRNMSRITPLAGASVKGRVSVHGKKYPAFTSSILVSIDTRLVNIAVIMTMEYPVLEVNEQSSSSC